MSSEFFVKPNIQFEWPEYTVFGLVLASSLGIGIFYGFFGSKNKTNEEFLLAARSMGVIPVTLSLICTYVSGVGLLGNPAEIYSYGTQYSMVIFGFPLMTILLIYIYVPVYVRLRLTSAFEYFEWRFSKRVRILCSIFSLIYLLIYMPITVYGPSLALDKVTGINQYASCAAIFIVCIAYSSLGGLKAVLWTDSLQGGVMLVSLLAIIICGIHELGGIGEVIKRNTESNRIHFFNLDPDPRTRHTLWTGIFGGLGYCLPIFGATQAQIQRYNAVPNLRRARMTVLLNMIGLISILCIVYWIGMMIYAKYHDCDPLGAKIINSSDQLLPLFVMEVLGKYPGLPGLLVGGLTCGTLSSVSSAINALTATITEDCVKHFRPGMNTERLAVISKSISLLSGMVGFLLIFPIAAINQSMPIVPLATLVAGCLLTPIFGAFTLAMFFPWANEKGTLLGMAVSIAVCVSQGLGQILAGRAGMLPDQKFFLTTDGCKLNNGTDIYNFNPRIPRDYVNPWKERSDSWEIQLWSLSYTWLPGIGIGTTIFFGLVFSALFNLSTQNKKRTEEHLFAYPLLNFWKRVFGGKYIAEWIIQNTE